MGLDSVTIGICCVTLVDWLYQCLRGLVLVWFILRPCQHDDGYIDGQLEIKVHTDKWTRVHSARSSLMVTHPGNNWGRRWLPSVNVPLSLGRHHKHWYWRGWWQLQLMYIVLSFLLHLIVLHLSDYTDQPTSLVLKNLTDLSILLPLIFE